LSRWRIYSDSRRIGKFAQKWFLLTFGREERPEQFAAFGIITAAGRYAKKGGAFKALQPFLF